MRGKYRVVEFKMLDLFKRSGVVAGELGSATVYSIVDDSQNVEREVVPNHPFPPVPNLQWQQLSSAAESLQQLGEGLGYDGERNRLEEIGKPRWPLLVVPYFDSHVSPTRIETRTAVHADTADIKQAM